jgi:hypothetical protein
MVQVRPFSCVCAVRADLLGLQLAASSRLVSSRDPCRSLHHPYGLVPIVSIIGAITLVLPIVLGRHPSRLARPLDHLALYLNVVTPFVSSTLVLLVSMAYNVVFCAVDNVPAVRVNLDTSRQLLLASMPSWPGMSTRRVRIAVAVVRIAFRTLWVALVVSWYARFVVWLIRLVYILPW